MSINRVCISGNLTRDASLKQTASGFSISQFSVAVNDRRKDANGQWSDFPNFVDCVMFGTRAEKLSDYLKKGVKVAIDGKLRYSSWQDQQGGKRSKLEVVVEDIELMQRNQQQAQPQQEYVPVVYQEDIPF